MRRPRRGKSGHADDAVQRCVIAAGAPSAATVTTTCSLTERCTTLCTMHQWLRSVPPPGLGLCSRLPGRAVSAAHGSVERIARNPPATRLSLSPEAWSYSTGLSQKTPCTPTGARAQSLPASCRAARQQGQRTASLRRPSCRGSCLSVRRATAVPPSRTSTACALGRNLGGAMGILGC